jgi:hypothetical protein
MASKAYDEILAREERGSEPRQHVTVRSIVVRNIADEEVNPYLVVYSESRRLFTTAAAKGLRSAAWSKIDRTEVLQDGQPIFVEVWGSDWGGDSFLGGFVIYPERPAAGEDGLTTVCRAPLEWDWKQRTTTSRQGYAEVTLEFDAAEKKGRR